MAANGLIQIHEICNIVSNEDTNFKVQAVKNGFELKILMQIIHWEIREIVPCATDWQQAPYSNRYLSRPGGIYWDGWELSQLTTYKKLGTGIPQFTLLMLGYIKKTWK